MAQAALAAMEEAEDEIFIETAIQAVLSMNNSFLCAEDDDEVMEDGAAVDHRKLPRAKRTIYFPAEALHCIMRDYLGPTPVFNDKQFDMMFRISRTRFQCIMEDIGATGNKFYLNTVDAAGKKGASFEARLLLPLKALAYGVAPHAFSDYFQMSPGFARKCCKKFDLAMMEVYQKEYLRLPTAADLKAITKLHKSVHKVDGMFGSLDCCHTSWKNCPTAWQGSYKGKEKKATIVLEAICDYHLWFWHASYGYAGTLNDKNILNLSPFLGSLVNGSFSKLEKEAGVVPFTIIQGEEFKKAFVLVDGIYPRYTRFVRGIKEPIKEYEKSYTGWQEAARKDIERAFGVLQCKFQWFARPIHMMDLNDIAKRAGTCMILHNMCVSDRIMDGDCRARYNPAASIDEEEDLAVESPGDLEEVQEQDGAVAAADAPGIGIARAPASVVNLVLGNKQQWRAEEEQEEEKKQEEDLLAKVAKRKQEWQDLDNTFEHARLMRALMILKSKWKRI